MKVNTKATGISLTPAISEYIQKKISALEKFYKNDEEILVNIEVGKISNRHKSGDIFRAEIHLVKSRGNEYYAAVEKDDLYAAIDEIKDEIIRELTSKRKKTIRLFRKGGAQIKNLLKGIKDVGNRGWRKFRSIK